MNTVVQLAPDLTFSQFLERLQPTPIKGGSAVVTPEGRTVQFVARRFADDVVRLIAIEPIADRWYYRDQEVMEG
jgi:hypothetical protein